jgi:hypothetical protein
MGTISDKLMRIINTKEDIRQALISKGYDVPTSIPFKEYAKMISDLPCRVDSFPDIEGIVARYSALGLTNEQMAANPVWADKTGNDHDLQMKNFAWGGMSGVGGYSDNFSSDSWKKPSDRSDITWTSSSFNITRVMNTGVQIYYFSTWEESESVIPEKRIIVKGLEDGQVLRYMNVGNRIIEISQDGIYTIPSFTFKGANFYHGYSLAKKQESCNVTVEQLPLYPGALVFDGVDDCGVCDNFPILTKEKGYTVVALRSYLAESIGYLVYNGTNAKQSAFAFERSDSLDTWSWGKNSSIRNSLPKLMSYQTSNSYNNNPISTGEVVESNNIINVAYGGGYCNVAIWELVFLDHDATEEELTKIKDYFVKTYPWLFPDQAWTVTGKTNEDEDRATIANITGNGNDLVLSNFGFAEGSGYGLYAYNFNSFDLRDNVVKPTDVKKDSFRIIGTGNSSNVLVLSNTSNSAVWKIRITGMKEGDSCIVGNANKSGDYIKIIKDGIYTFQKQYAATSINGIWYNSSQEVDVLVEQIPEYEGYLITDGVDDKAVSKQFKFGENFTVILDFKFPVKKISYCGFDLSSKVRIQNLQGSGVYVVLKGNKTLIPSNVVRAVTSEGKVYDENWNEYNIVPGNISSNYTMVNLGFDGSNQFAESATKLAGIYSSILSKDECIKAYNYLQTLKSK